jgi:hypothetical protein
MGRRKEINMRCSICLLVLMAIRMIVPSEAAEFARSTPTNTAVPKVVGVWPNELALGQTITVKVANLYEWSQQNAENDPTKLVPLINGHKLSGLYPTETYLRSSNLVFRLAISEPNKDAWTDLLREPLRFSYPVSVTVGLEGKDRFDTEYRYKSKDLRLIIMPKLWTLVSLVAVGFMGVILVRYSRMTDLIRDATPFPPPSGHMRPYNLGRTQMAFWFFLIMASYVVLWLITGSLDTITPSLVALMGISSGTALGDALVDANKRDSEAAQRRALEAEKKSLQNTVAELDAQLTGAGASTAPASATTLKEEKQMRLKEVDTRLKELEPTDAELVSQGFVHDLLSDGHQYSFHRFQIVAWTVVLGVIFVASVYEGLHMPEFNSTLLGLMGLSAGAYVSLKFPER